MIKKINGIKYNLEVGQIETFDADVLFLWTTPAINSGDASFVRVRKEAGSIVYEQCLAATMKYGVRDNKNQYVIPPGQCIITNAGNLKAYNIIHGVLPNYRIKEQRDNRITTLTNTISIGAELTKAYADSFMPMNILSFPPIPPIIYGDVLIEDIKAFIQTILKLKDFKKINIIFETEEEYNLYVKIFLKLTTSSWERILNKIFKFEF